MSKIISKNSALRNWSCFLFDNRYDNLTEWIAKNSACLSIMKINNDSEFHPFLFKQRIPLFPAQNVLYCYQTTQKVFNSDIFINQKYWKQIFFGKHFRDLLGM